mmetsp:Transcript_19911/g.25708  ORF Transcript_19911/g.25708 Transcript_19911/m.25708 type:complete len:450 (+) Transcript_19911:233-1582(+)
MELFKGLLSIHILGYILLGREIRADFVYPDFNQTTGLVFNGDAATSGCTNIFELDYGDVHGDGDNFNGSLPTQQWETISLTGERTQETNIHEKSIEDITIFGHCKEFAPSPDHHCAVRLRLTPSLPAKVGTVWYRNPLPVNLGFSTLFTFQVSDHSKVCTLHKDPDFSLIHHKTCSVHGGDGLSFVIHGDPAMDLAIGRKGSQLGYGGMENALAIEFDTWYNPDTNSSDLVYDHVSLHTGGHGENTAWSFTEITSPRTHNIGDGQVHLVKIKYLPYLEFVYFKNFTANQNLIQYLKDNGENRRVGTLLVFMDEGVSSDDPLFAVPINLSVTLKLQQERAYAGFTAATGRAWEKHDVLSWYWCDELPCEASEEFATFDYHRTSRFSSASHAQHHPGHGYGGGKSTKAPTQHQSPDTTPWGEEKLHFSNDRNEGLFTRAQAQVPPNTEVRR